MATFRKKPSIGGNIGMTVHAERFRGGEQSHEMDQLTGGVATDAIRYPEDGTMLVRTVDGEMVAVSGDWIVRDIDGLHHFNPDIFAATYEPDEHTLP